MLVRVVAAASAALFVSTLASAQTMTFESPSYAGSAGGVPLPGQNGWYTPVTTPASTPYNVHSYSGNSLGMSTNPDGGDQFIAVPSGAASAFGRGQLDVNFSAGGQWRFTYDMNMNFVGTATGADNLGSFSLQSSTANRSFTAVNRFVNVATPASGWRASFIAFDAAGVQLAIQDPGPAWVNLPFNTWFRQSVLIDFTTNRVLELSITDIVGGTTSTVTPTDWFLLGGANPVQPLPTAIRVFTGGDPNNIAGWDNITIIPAPGAAALLGIAGLAAARRRR